MLVSPELVDVLSAVVSRLRAPNGAIPLVAAYDVRERVWNPPVPPLFRRKPPVHRWSSPRTTFEGSSSPTRS